MGEASKRSRNDKAQAEKQLRAFGAALRSVRLQKGKSQEQVGWDSGIDRKFISFVERGVKEPGFRTILLLCDALEISLSEFMERVEAALDAESESE